MKTLEDKLRFKKMTILNLNQMNRILGGVGDNGGDGDDDGDNRTRHISSKVCDPEDNGN